MSFFFWFSLLLIIESNPAVKFAPLRCAGTALKRSPLPSRWASFNA